MATKLSQRDTKLLLEGGFFNNWEVTSSFNKDEIGSKVNEPLSKDERNFKVKIKFRDKDKSEHIGFVIDITATEQLKVLEEEHNQVVTHLVKPTDIIGVFFVTLGREVEINFGVGKSSISSLVDEY